MPNAAKTKKPINNGPKKGSSFLVWPIVVLVVAVGAFYFVYSDYFKSSKGTQVPKEFVLSQQNLEKLHQDSNNLDFARYTLNKPIAQVYEEFVKRLTAEKYQIAVDTKKNLPEGAEFESGTIFAKNEKYRINVFLQSQAAGTTKVEVTYLPR